MNVQLSETIDCHPSALWPWIDETDKAKQWLRGLESAVPITKGPKRPGHETTLRIREGRKLSEYKQTILEYEPEKRFKMRMEGGCLRGMAMIVDYRLVDLGNHRTRLDYECTAEATGFMRILAKVFAVFGRMQARSFFRELKRLAEGADAGRVPA
jgi:carbon monoxide dehydrogenase subunit G